MMGKMTTKGGKVLNWTYSTPTTGSCSTGGISDVSITNHQGMNVSLTQEELSEVFENMWNTVFNIQVNPMFITGPVNYRSSFNSTGGYYTQTFLQWLIDVKKQYVIFGPVHANANYSVESPHLNQCAIWYPSKLMAAHRVIPDSHGSFNQPSTEREWGKGVKSIGGGPKDMTTLLTKDKDFVVNRYAKALDTWAKANEGVAVKTKCIVNW